MLHRLVYYSDSTDSFRSIDDIKSLLVEAREQNKKRCITGALFFDERYFVQILEGGRNELSELYYKIINDSRHTNPVMVGLETITERDFSSWSMMYLGGNNINDEVILKFSPTIPFDPRRMHVGNIIAMMKHVKTHRIEEDD